MLPADAPDLVELDLLSSVAELGSLGRAAARHHLSQPAVSMRMTQLEARLGLRLLERDASGTQLTDAGLRMLELGRRVLQAVDDLLSGAGALRAEAGTRLRIAASLTVAEHLLPAWVSALHGEVPEFSLALDVTNSARVTADVVAGAVDLGFVEGRPHSHPGLASAVTSGDRMVLVVAPSHPWAGRPDPVGGAELAATELIVREEGSGTREVLEAALVRVGGVRSRMALGSTTAVLAAVRRGEGPAVLSDLAVADAVDAGQVVVVATEGLDLSREFRALWSTARPLPALARRLLDVAASDHEPRPGGGRQA